MKKRIIGALVALIGINSMAADDEYHYQGTPISTAVIVSFPDSSAAFKPDESQVEILSAAKDAAAIFIRGRTSTDKPSKQDEALALTRAISARNYLIARGVSPLKISINYASAMDFIASNQTREGRMLNQRVEVELVHIPLIAD